MRLRLYRFLHRATAPRRGRLGWGDLAEIALVALGFLLYFVVRGAVVDRTADALANARRIVDLQRALGVFVEPEINRWVLDAMPAIRVVNFVYFWLDFPLIVAVGLLLFWRRRRSYTLLRDALLISGGVALVVYWTFPVAPPRYLAEWGFVDTMAEYSRLAYQTQSTSAFVNPFAAVPSLHVGWALLVVVVVFEATPRSAWRAAAIAVLALQVVAVVATANHYLFDVVAGVAVAMPALAAARRLRSTGYPALRRRLIARARAERLRAAGGSPPAARVAGAPER